MSIVKPARGADIARRELLRTGALLGLSCLSPGVLAHTPKVAEKRLRMKNLHTGESVNTVFWANGAYDSGGLAEIDHLLRDFRTGDVLPIDRRLLDLLHELRAALDSDAPYEVVSGYRSPKTNAMLASRSKAVAKRSLHTLGMAADVRLKGRRLRDLRRAAKSLQAGGVGYYPKTGFVHVDVGRVRYW